MQPLRRVTLYLLAFCCAFLGHSEVFCDNQTEDLSPIACGKKLPFEVKIRRADFDLPNGWHSGVYANYEGKWVFLAGRTNGLHGFDGNNDNFPPQAQNTTVYVVDSCTGGTWSRSLEDAGSGLTQHQIDLLSVTSPQYYQSGKTLYITGGYGVDTATGEFSTKDTLTAIDIPSLIYWVTHSQGHTTVADCIRQICNPVFQVTGGYMSQYGDEPTLLIFGQNFDGFYLDSSNGIYTEQVRRFHIHDNGHHLSVKVLKPKPFCQDPNYRRRDLNVIPFMHTHHNCTKPNLIALSGVFTLTGGAWTVPVTISNSGTPHMADPNHQSTFKQGMNNYICANVGLFSEKTSDMYAILLGGISYGYFEDGIFETDAELPFINQVTTIRSNKYNHLKQYLMKAKYPTIISRGSNPGNLLLFGAAAQFIPVDNFPAYDNGVLKFEAVGCHSTLVGYIVGGIQSTVPNTSTITDSAASPYIFKVFLKKKAQR